MKRSHKHTHTSAQDGGDHRKRNIRFTVAVFAILTASIGAALLLAPRLGAVKAARMMAAQRYVATGGVNAGDCSNIGSPCATLAYAISQSAASDMINVAAGTYVLTSTVGVNVASLTIKGASSATTIFQVAGAVGNAMTVTGAGVTIQDLQVQKTDLLGSPQSLILINANNVTIKNNLIRGQDPGSLWSVNGLVFRGLEVAGSLSGLLIQGNTFLHLRQPAYINPGTVGQVINNNASGTRGWVVDGAKITFTGNSWGSPPNQGADIALLVSVNPADYPDLVALSNANNNAYISGQFLGASSGRAVAYVDDSAAPGGDGSSGLPFQTINAGVGGALPGGKVNVAAGLYVEDVNVNKTLVVSGSGVANTTVSGPIGGSGSTFTISASNVELKNFKITREGNNTTDWNNAGLNSAGVSIIGTALTGMNVHDNLITQNRTGIDVNNTSGHTIRNNVITDNRTGLLFRNQTDNLTVVENYITNNWTVGVLFLDASGGTNVPVQTALNCAFFNNDLSGNWYGQIVDRQSGGSLPAPGTTNLKNFSGNWYGTNAPIISVANSAEPGYSAQIPVAFGGSATPPGGQPDVLGPASANFDITPLLETGVDTNVETTLGRGVYGFQGNFNNLRVIASGAQTGSGGRIQEGINLTGVGGTVNVAAGTYNESVAANKAGLILKGAQAGVSACGRSASESIINQAATSPVIVTANNITLDGFTIQGAAGGLNSGIHINGVYSGSQILNNIVQNNIHGLYLNNNSVGNSTLVQGNSFKTNNNPGSANGNDIYSDQGLFNATITKNCFDGSFNAAILITATSTVNNNITISNNVVTNSRAVILLMSSNVSITGNTASGAPIGSSVSVAGGVSNVTIEKNTLINNAVRGISVSDPYALGANTIVSIRCNRIVGNPSGGLEVFAGGYTGTLTAENNWWGCNAGPGGAGCDAVINNSSATVDFNPWLVLGLAAAPSNPPVNTPSTLTASLKKNSNGVVAPCTVPDGTPVSFAGTGGTISPANTTTTGGMAMSTYTAGNTPGAFSASTTVDNQTVSTAINVTTAPVITCPVDITVGSDAGKNTASVPFTVTATGSPSPTVTCKAGSTTITSPYNFPVGTTTVSCTATNGNTPDATCSFKVTVNKVSASLNDPLACTGPGNTVTGAITITNNGNATANTVATTTLPGGLLALPGTCSASVGTCSVDSASQISYSNSIPAGQTVTITYQAQVGDQVTTGTKLCATTEVSFNGGPKSNAQACITVNCSTVGPGAIPDAESPVSDQKAGSVLIYNVYTSSASDANSQNTRINLTNIDQKRSVFVHLFFVDGETCSVADNYLCLTANQTTTFLTSDVDPGTTGYLVAVAIDSQGCPINFNNLIGDEFVKFSSGHAANLGAEAISALAGGLPRCDGNSVTARLDFDGKSYNALPRVLALSNIASRANGNDTMLILNRIGGDLTSSASALTNVFGNFYDDTETGLSFSFNPKTCQLRSSITNSFPRLAPRFDQFVPAGRSGWFKLYSVDDQAILGAAINFNQNGEGSPGAYNQGHNLHKLTLTTSASFTIPVFPPSC